MAPRQLVTYVYFTVRHTGIKGELTLHNILRHETSEGFHHEGCITEGRKEIPSQHHCTSLHLIGTPLGGGRKKKRKIKNKQKFKQQNTFLREKGFAQVF